MQKNKPKVPPVRTGGSFFLTAPYLVWMVIFILIPLGVVVFYALTDPATGLFSLDNLGKVFTGAFPKVFGRSIWYALLAALICLVIGYPVAYYIAHRKPAVQRFLYMLVMLPMCMSFLLRTQGLVQQQHLRLVDQRPGNGYPLLLAAGQGSNFSGLISLQADNFQHFGDTPVDLVLWQLGNAQAEGDIVKYIQMGEQSIPLEYGIDLPLIGGDVIHARSVE